MLLFVPPNHDLCFQGGKDESIRKVEERDDGEKEVLKPIIGTKNINVQKIKKNMFN